MGNGNWRLRVGWVVGSVGLLLSPGCGSGGDPVGTPPSEDVELETQQFELTPAMLDTSMPRPWDAPEWRDGDERHRAVASLARFWALDRFFINGDKGVKVERKLDVSRLAKAEPDECYNGIGEPLGRPPCTEGRPKVNDAYVWGLTRAGSSLWFGTIANTHCLVQASYLGLDSPQETDYWVCEFGASASGTGDFRAPHLYRYDLASGTLELKDPPAGSPAEMLRRTTVGLRSAGNAGGVVFLAGPSLVGGINMFAYDADTGALLGARNFPAYDDIRSWVTARGVLYTGVGLSSIPSATSPGGLVLRWVGEKSTDPARLFAFAVVGELDSSAANLVEHAGRLYVSTWPTLITGTGSSAGPRYTGLWRSPRLETLGLSSRDVRDWKKVWDIRDYEPDPVAALTTGGGALASFDGRLYWGTMHVPALATQVALALHRAGTLDLDANRNGRVDPVELLTTALGTHRSITLFQSDDLGTSQQFIRILYGEKYLPRYSPEARGYTIAYDAEHRNRMRHWEPRFGSSGLGNFFNAYTWSMEVYRKQLYVGTFDWSQLARVGLQDVLEVDGAPVTAAAFGETEDRLAARRAGHDLYRLLAIAIPREGADLFRFAGRSRCAEAESLTGVGNFTNYGVRTMVTGEGSLFIGTANPMNLHPRGGWELLELRH